MKFTEEEKILIKNCIKKYEEENDQKIEEDRDGVILAVNMGHDFYSIISDPKTHRLMETILTKCGEHIETAEEKVVREEKERKISEKERKRRLKEEIEKKHKEELEKEMKYYGLVEEEVKEEAPREDFSRVETFNNFAEIRKEREEAEALQEQIAEIPPVNLENLDTNTVAELKEFANFMQLEYDPRILKADLIDLIKENI